MKALFNYLILLAAISSVLLLGSCSKDDDPTPADIIVGNWQISTVEVDITVGSQSFVDFLISQGLSTADAQAFAAQLEDGYGDIDGNIEIKKGGTYSTTSGGTTDTGTWELSSDGKTLTLDKGTVDAFVFTVTTLTSSNLNLEGEQSETDDGITLTIQLEMKLTK